MLIKGELIMNKVQSLDLFKELQLVSTKYRHLKLNNENQEVEDNKKLNSLLHSNSLKKDEIYQKCYFVYDKTREELKNASSNEINKILLELNNFCSHRYESLKNIDIKSTTTRAVILATLDELIIINKSMINNDYINDIEAYTMTYEEVLVNAFITFLSLKEMDIDELIMNSLSQSIFSHIKALALISYKK